MKLLIIVLSLIALVGCGSTPTKPNIQYTPVPEYIAVYTPPAELKNIVIPTRPNLVINQLSSTDLSNSVIIVRAQLMTINQLIKYSEDLETTLQNYQTIVNTESKNQDPQEHK